MISFNYRRVGGIAMGALLALILARRGMLFHIGFMPGLYSWAALAIFTALLLVDFARIKEAATAPPPSS